MKSRDNIPAIDFSRPEARAAKAAALRVLFRPAWKKGTHKRLATVYQQLEPHDLMWVREDHVEFTDRRRPMIMGLGYGGIAEAVWPRTLKHNDCKVRAYPPSAMCRAASRFTLEIARTKVMRLHDVDDDLLADWAMQRMCSNGVAGWVSYGQIGAGFSSSLREAAQHAWDEQCPAECHWSSNPLIVAIRPIIHFSNIFDVQKARAAS